MGWGCCQTSTGPTPDGLSMPLGSVIFGHLTPLAPSSAAILRPGGIMRLRLSRDFSSRSVWPQSAQCAACHQYISMWNLPNQELTPRPVSCGGSGPESWTAMRYCERTMRRSSSAARGSELPERSMTPPVVQYCCQWVREADSTAATGSGSVRIFVGEKQAVSSMLSAELVRRN